MKIKVVGAILLCSCITQGLPQRVQDVYQKTNQQSITSVLVGTDIPYQHFIGISHSVNYVTVSLRTGLLVPPYSDLILKTLEVMGTNEAYIQLLESSYEFGWMNSLGMYYRFGNTQKWYLGPEFRVDHLIAPDTPDELIESVTGEEISRIVNRGANQNQNNNTRLSITTFALGLRFGRVFRLIPRHRIHAEISLYKHVGVHTQLESNGERIPDQNLENLFWEDVFKPYGYLGGIGIVYSYSFRN
jgi:hypothetical protein